MSSVKEASKIVTYAHSAAVTAWVPISVAILGVLVPITTGLINAVVSYYRSGIFKYAIANSIVIAVGNLVYYDTAANRVTLIRPAAGFLLGKAITGGTGNVAGSVLVEVDINEFDDVQETLVTLTAAQVKTLNGTPVTVIAAPGAGKAIVVESVIGKLNFVAAGYDSVGIGDDLTLKYTGSSGATIVTMETTGWLDQTASAYQTGRPATSVIPVANAVVVAHVLTGEIYTSAGDGTLSLLIRYRVVTLI